MQNCAAISQFRRSWQVCAGCGAHLSRQAYDWWDSRAVTGQELDVSLADDAVRLEPAELRSVDPLHLAAALRLGPALGSMVSYDERMMDAARRHGLAVAHPLAGHPRSETHRRERGRKCNKAGRMQ